MLIYPDRFLEINVAKRTLSCDVFRLVILLPTQLACHLEIPLEENMSQYLKCPKQQKIYLRDNLDARRNRIV